MKQKVIVIILSVLLGIFVLYGVMATFAIRESMSEVSQLETKYSEVIDDYKELSNKHQDNVYSVPIVLDTIARSIDEKATVNVIDNNVVSIYVPYSSGVKDKVEQYIWGIPTTLENDGYNSCIITVIDNDGKCVFGWTILSNGKTYAFLSE